MGLYRRLHGKRRYHTRQYGTRTVQRHARFVFVRMAFPLKFCLSINQDLSCLQKVFFRCTNVKLLPDAHSLDSVRTLRKHHWVVFFFFQMGLGVAMERANQFWRGKRDMFMGCEKRDIRRTIRQYAQTAPPFHTPIHSMIVVGGIDDNGGGGRGRKKGENGEDDTYILN